MAPRRTGKVRVEGLQVKDDLAGARADGDHHHHNKTQSSDFIIRYIKEPRIILVLLTYT